jgi:very-short-patch-repair endonuclease
MMTWYPYPTRKVGVRQKADPKKLKLAKQMRQNPTKAEALLWDKLRCNQLKTKFRRQTVIRGWIVDFWCPQFNLVVEVDGSSHNTKRDYDDFRDAVMSDLRIKVLRFTNEEIFDDIGCVLKHIKAHLRD